MEKTIFRVSIRDLSGIQTDPKLALALGEVYSGVKTGLVFSLGAFATVFQVAVHESIARGYKGRTIAIFTDSLESPGISDCQV